MKKISWGHIWTQKSEDLDKCVELWWPSLGRNWTAKKCLDDFELAKIENDIGKTSKVRVYKVVLEDITDSIAES